MAELLSMLFLQHQTANIKTGFFVTTILTFLAVVITEYLLFFPLPSSLIPAWAGWACFIKEVVSRPTSQLSEFLAPCADWIH